MPKLTFKAFRPGAVEMLKIKSYEAIADEVRREAEAFIAEIGPENVVSITENAWMNHFAVVVWYHAPSTE